MERYRLIVFCYLVSYLLIHMSSFTSAIDICDDISEYHHMMGRVMWEMGGEARSSKTSCFSHFLKVQTATYIP